MPVCYIPAYLSSCSLSCEGERHVPLYRFRLAGFAGAHGPAGHGPAVAHDGQCGRAAAAVVCHELPRSAPGGLISPSLETTDIATEPKSAEGGKPKPL